MPNGSMNIADKVEVQNSGKTFRIGCVSGKGALGGSCTFSNGASVGANTWQVGNEKDWMTNVRVVSNANLTKVGTGKVTWSAANTNTGMTTISEGELFINTSTKLGTGRLTIGAEGLLSGTNSEASSLINPSVIVSGTVRPGVTASAYTGTIYFGGKTVTFNEGSVLQVCAGRGATSNSNGCTSVAGINKLIMNGTIRVVLSKNYSLQVGDSVRLWTAESFSGQPTFEFDPSISWDTSRISEGLLFVTGVNLGISGLKATALDPHAVYDLMGRKVRSNDTDLESLPAGIYVRGGRKFIIK